VLVIGQSGGFREQSDIIKTLILFTTWQHQHVELKKWWPAWH